MQSLISFSLTCEASVELNKPSFATLALASFQPGVGRYSQTSCTHGNPALRFASATQFLLRDLILTLLESKISSCVFWKTRSLSPQWKGDKCDQHQRSDDKLKKERSPDHRPIISCVFSESRSLETPRYWEIFHRGYFLVKLPGRSMYRSGIYSTCSTSYCGAEYFWRFFPSAD